MIFFIYRIIELQTFSKNIRAFSLYFSIIFYISVIILELENPNFYSNYMLCQLVS